MKLCLPQQIFDALQQLFLVFHPAFLLVLSKSTSQILAILSKPEMISRSNTFVFLIYIIYNFLKVFRGTLYFSLKNIPLVLLSKWFGRNTGFIKISVLRSLFYHIWIVESSHKICLALFRSEFQELICHLHLTNVCNINWIPILPDGTCSIHFETYLHTCIFFST